MLKFEGKFSVGDIICVRDCPDTHVCDNPEVNIENKSWVEAHVVIGEIVKVDAKDTRSLNFQGALEPRGYRIRVLRDNARIEEYKRVGKVIFVPYELKPHHEAEYTAYDRITLHKQEVVA